MKKLFASVLIICLLLCSCAQRSEFYTEDPDLDSVYNTGAAVSEAPVPTVAPAESQTPEVSDEPVAEAPEHNFQLVIDPVVSEAPQEDAPEGETAAPEAETDIQPIEHEHLPDLGITVRYKDQEIDIGCMLYNTGRLYLSRSELEAAIGRTANGKDAYLPDIDGCIDLADIALQYDISISITAVNHAIDLYDARTLEVTGASGTAQGYIRLEDVRADGAYNDGNYYYDAAYSSYNLEKLRSMGEYLYSRGQKFYIAWIPVYVDPDRGVVNNPVENQCLYNADFLFSLDYLRIMGGKIVLHGYTHQQFDTESSVGNEFGDDSEYTTEQMAQRMDKAIEIAKALGYETDVFEFPHYALTDDSRALAESRFDYIYQYGPSSTTQITHTERNGRDITYVPTPPDYVYSPYDQEIFDRLQTAHDNGQLVSLFFHPTIDFNYCGMRTEDGVHYWTYDQENGFLPRLVDKIESMGDGYIFSYFN